MSSPGESLGRFNRRRRKTTGRRTADKGQTRMNGTLDRLRNAQILICGDTERDIESIRAVLAADGYARLSAAIGVAEVSARVAATAPDLVILNLTTVVPESCAAIETLCGLIRKKAKVPLVVLASDIPLDSQLCMIERGASGIVEWPGRPEELRQRVRDKLGAFLLHEDGGARGAALEQRLQELTHQLRETEARVNHLRNHDLLTGLPNYVLVQELLAEALIDARTAEHKLGVMLVDIDRFRDVVCDLDYSSGDNLLWEAALRISECAGPTTAVGRVGHHEFAVIQPTLQRPIDAEILARSILEALSRPFELDYSEVILSASIGIAVFPDGCETRGGGNGNAAAVEADGMLKCAANALQRAKQSGGDAFRFSTTNVTSRRHQRQLEVDLSRAVERQEFTLYFQPFIEIETGKITGAEALLRWQRPTGEVVPPGTFMGLAESTGLIVPIGEWVIDTACRQISQWTQGPLSDLLVSVNLSPRQCRDTKFAQTIEHALSIHNVDPKSIVLEVTENVLLDRENRWAIAGLQELRECGVQVALDDFGSGYSSFGYLNDITFDILKIDRSFIQTLPQNGVNDAIIRAICAMAHTLGLTVVAEGVETAQQVARVRASLCDRIQGYYFSKPLATPAFEQFFNSAKLKNLFQRPDFGWDTSLPLAGIMPAIH